MESVIKIQSYGLMKMSVCKEMKGLTGCWITAAYLTIPLHVTVDSHHLFLPGYHLEVKWRLLLLWMLLWLLLVSLDCHLQAKVLWTTGSPLQLTGVILPLQRQSPQISASLSRSVRITTARKHGLLYHMPPQLLSACVCRMSWYSLHRLWASVYCTIPQCV